MHSNTDIYITIIELLNPYIMRTGEHMKLMQKYGIHMCIHMISYHMVVLLIGHNK